VLKRVVFLVGVLAPPVVTAQELPLARNTGSESMRHAWRASWITHPTASVHDHGVFHFRRGFDLPERPSSFTIHVSADNRYRLFVNGVAVGEGPARDDLHHWPYDTIDVAAHLRAGANLIAAQVVNFGEHRSGGQFSDQTAFILQSRELPDIDTDARWKVTRNDGMRANPVTRESFPEYDQVLGYYAAGPLDALVAEHYPWGWERLGFEDGNWPAARPIRKGVGTGFAFGSTWLLVPRSIGMLAETTAPITSLERATLAVDEAFLSGESHLTVPAHATASVLLDHEALTMGYPQLAFSGGADSHVKMTYAESLFDEHFLKGDRNETENKRIYGVYDTIRPDGGKGRSFRPTWIRTFRYLQIDVTTQDDPLILEDLTVAETAYPLREKARFESSDASLSSIWEASWRALRLGARDTYYSDAYFEQMQYIGDARVQGLATMVVSGDSSLFKNALRQFDQSRLPNGLTQSRYPARELQIIPTYSLLYIAMVHDYLMHRSDPEFVESLLPGIHSILAWFEARVDDTGLPTGLEWWNFCDWALEYPVGIPPGADDGYSALVALQYVYALQKAADVFGFYGLADAREASQERARRTQEAVRRLCFDERRGLYAETPEKEEFSQHTNIFAVLTDTHPEAEQASLMQRVTGDEGLIQTTFYFKFYLFEALRHCGLANAFLRQLDPWRKFIDLGLTTFPEDDSDRPRSDCHPWSSSPVYFLLSLTAGIQPTGPGFRSLEIVPALGDLEFIDVTYPHPLGDIVLRLEREGRDGLRGQARIPEGLDEAVFEWNGERRSLKAGDQEIRW